MRRLLVEEQIVDHLECDEQAGYVYASGLGEFDGCEVERGAVHC